MRCAILFDIDGTILRAAGSGARALTLALTHTTGLPTEQIVECLQSIDFRGATDRSIVAQLDTKLQINLAQQGDTFLQAYLHHLEYLLTTIEVEVMPGIQSLLAQLTQLGDVSLGLLTGNYRRAAQLKLRSVNLEHLVTAASAFGEDGVHRNELAATAARRLAAKGIDPKRTIVIGDTQHDISCGKHIGAYTVAVSTGWTDHTMLHAAGPDLLFSDLSDSTTLMGLVHQLREA